MFYFLSAYLQPYVSGLNVVHYISFRTIAALLQSLVLTIFLGNIFIKKYASMFASQARELTPETHRKKNNIPTMGGILMLFVVVITSLCWVNWSKLCVWIFLGGIIIFGLIGFWDDWNKITKKKGIPARQKWILTIGSASLISLALIVSGVVSSQVHVPFFKNFHPELGFFFLAWAIFMIVGCSNAVNLTDGLDGLASGVILPNLGTFALLIYASSHYQIASYLHVPFTGNAEVTVICGAFIGTVLGFLWYNAHPAQMFMGDVGSLSLGCALALLGLLSKQEILLALSGGVFVVETLSVILQVASFKCRGQRIFKMAPLHHHFELQGIHETKITTRFIIISIVLCLLAMITIKIR